MFILGDIAMELQDTADLMKSRNFKDRFKAEYYQLKIRTDKLGATLDAYDKGTLTFTPKCGIELLTAQHQFMTAYLHTLEERAVIEGIEL
jgi:hypothetical protein